MTKEYIYAHMLYEYINPDPRIPCEFEDGKPCMDLYGKVCDARERIADRTGIDFEDRDLMDMIENMEDIAKFCALKMFDYGAQYGKPELA